MNSNDNKSKIGAGHASAMLRQGLSELRQAVYPDSNVAAPPQYGLYGTLTPGEVAEARRSDERDLNEEPRSVLGEHVKQAEATRGSRERDDRHIERD